MAYGCNGLYSYAIKQEMPTGVYVRRKFSNNFRPEVSEKYIDSYVWMDYIMERDQIFIKHKLNNQHEVRFGNYLVNGYRIGTKTVYAFNGCYYHHCPHNCFVVKNIKNKKWLDKIKLTEEKDKQKRKFISEQCYNVITIQQFKFLENFKSKCMKFYDNYLPSYYQNNKTS